MHNPLGTSYTPEYLALIRHLVSVVPECLEQKSSEGWTPLHVAIYTQHEEIVSYLISVGADQRARDKLGRNAVHALLAHHRYGAKTGRKQLESLIKHFDQAGIKDMLLERCTNSPGALTPLAYWLAQNNGSYKKPHIIEILSRFSTGEDLEMINGEGDLPLHVAVKQGLSSITAFLLSLNPALLHRENATGRTPLEMARDLYLTSTVQDPPNVFSSYRYNPNHDDYTSLVHQPAVSFVPVKSQPEESKKRTYEVCLEIDESLVEEGYEGTAKRKRRLVSLFEANEVAKRLAGNKSSGAGRQWVANGYAVDQQGKSDVVSEWMK